MNIRVLWISILLTVCLQSSVSHAFDFDALSKQIGGISKGIGNTIGSAVGGVTSGMAHGMADRMSDTKGLVQAVSNNTHKKQQRSKLAQDQKRTKIEGVVAGMALGGMAGSIFGNGDSDITKGIIVGGVAGYAVGSEIAKIKKSNALAQDKLNRQIALLNRSIQNTRLHNQVTQKRIKLTHYRIAKLGKNRVAKVALFKELSIVVRNKKNVIHQQKIAIRQHQNLIKTSVHQARQKKEKFNASRNYTKTAQLKRELNLLERSVTQLSNQRNRMMAS